MPHSFKNSKPLSVEEEQKLLRKAKAGDMAARTRLIQSNLRYVVKLARTRSFRSTNDSSFEDFIQEGLLALHIAIDKFDFAKTNGTMRLIGYAHAWIKVRQGNRAVADMSMVKFGTTQAQRILFSSLRRATEELFYILQRDPTDEELAQHLRVKPQEITDARLRLSQKDLSLNAPMGGDRDGSLSFIDQLLDPTESLEQQYETTEGRCDSVRRINEALALLNPRERLIIEKRHLCDEEDELTLREISEMWGCSRERVRQLETRAFNKMKRHFGIQEDGKPGRRRKEDSSGDQAPDGNRGATGREVLREVGGGQAPAERGENRAEPASGAPAGSAVPPPDAARKRSPRKARGGRKPSSGAGKRLP